MISASLLDTSEGPLDQADIEKMKNYLEQGLAQVSLLESITVESRDVPNFQERLVIIQRNSCSAALIFWGHCRKQQKASTGAITYVPCLQIT